MLVFVQKVEDVEKITKKLPKNSTRQLTGTLRGLERDACESIRFSNGSCLSRIAPGSSACSLARSTSSARAPVKLA